MPFNLHFGIRVLHTALTTTSRAFRDLPGPRRLPILGNLHQVEPSRLHLNLEDWARQYGPLYRLKFGASNLLVISDAKAIAIALKDRPDAFRRGSRSSRALSEVGTSGVFVAEGEDWKKQRKLVMRGFTRDVIQNFYPTLVHMTERMMRRWEHASASGSPVTLLRDFKAFTLDVAVGLAMGEDINTVENDRNPLQRDAEHIFTQVAKRLTKPFPYWRYVKLPADRAVDASIARIESAVNGFIARSRAKIRDNPQLQHAPANLLEALIMARDEPGSGFTDAHIAGNAVTMIFAGEDTTSNTLAWIVYFLAQHPEAAARVRQEADAVLQDDRVLRDYDALTRFPFLDIVITEAMRIKPVAPFLSLEANRDLELAGISVPAGTLILPLLRQIGQDPDQFPEPHAFRPERWMNERGADAGLGASGPLYSFGGGPRFCPGRYLAMAQLRMAISMLTRNFDMVLDTAAPPVQEMFTFTMTPSALPVSLVARKP